MSNALCGAQLARLRGRLRLQLALEFAADMAIVLTATAALLVLLDWWFRFSLPVRLVLLSLSLVGVFGFLGVRAWKRWRSSRMDELSLAMTLDRYRPGTGQQIADVLQLPDLLSDPRESASPAMVRLAVGQASAALAGSDWGSLWNRRRTFVHTGALLLGVLIPMMFAAFAPDPARLSVARWLFGSSERWPQRTYLTVMGLDDSGRLVVPRDERFMMEVRSDLPMVEVASRPLRRSWPRRAVDIEVETLESANTRIRRRPGTNRRGTITRRGDGRDRVGAIPVRVSSVAVVIDVQIRGRRRLAWAAHARASRPAFPGGNATSRQGAGSHL